MGSSRPSREDRVWRKLDGVADGKPDAGKRKRGRPAKKARAKRPKLRTGWLLAGLALLWVLYVV